MSIAFLLSLNFPKGDGPADLERFTVEGRELRTRCYEMKMHYSGFAEVYTTSNCR